ncbi:putative cobalt transporter subunit CbtB [Humibacillus xanthopallidus]|uniref:Putative cobalt transporter subunit CbtB n=1 Tax=Humibacillus xanthopallidus TaxID=412689 RepID=A0A543PL69_9MICO|nr:CbtB-domain containing protein [Humibacillus xanthopallidus]TQN44816.1 putative cobalt transporter subunit CbtB [Humibacillus xanthopallidus]
MTSAASASAVSPSVRMSVRASAVSVPVWAWALLAVAVFTLYVLAQENGAVLSAPAAELLHELTHDARHALGVPCH